jgi:hypothetical protein
VTNPLSPGWCQMALGLLCVFACNACERAARKPSATASIQRDTIGDTIVVHSTGPGLWGDSVALVEKARIGGTDGREEYTFGYIYGLAVSPEGVIYVGDAKVPIIRAYDSVGRFLRNVGRRGKGPGEYLRVSGLALLPDGRLLSHDADLNRVNVYSAASIPLGTLEWESPAHTTALDMLRTDARGNAYLKIMMGLPSPAGFPPMTFMRFDASGRARDTIPPVEWPKPPGTWVIYDPSGSWTLNRRGEVVAGYSDRDAIEIRKAGGRVVRIERGEKPVSISAGERRYRDSIMVETYKPEWMAKTGPLHKVPPIKPAFQSLAVDEDDRLWVQRHVRSVENPNVADTANPRFSITGRWYEPVKAWDVFRSDGTYLGRVTLPGKAEILFSRGDDAWGTLEDENGAISVIHWRITPHRK